MPFNLSPGNASVISDCTCPAVNYTGNRCPPGTYCPAGASRPLDCDPGYYCDDYELDTPTGMVICCQFYMLIMMHSKYFIIISVLLTEVNIYIILHGNIFWYPPNIKPCNIIVIIHIRQFVKTSQIHFTYRGQGRGCVPFKMKMHPVLV